MINEQNNHFKVGVLGASVLFQVLADNGYQDLALQLIEQDGFPSYKYWLDNGATSLWESFNEVYKGSMLRTDGGRVMSLNHHFWGTISAWFYKNILGITIDENTHEFVIAPKVFKNINNVSGSYIRNGNGVKVSINKNGDKLLVDVIPVGNTIFRIVNE